MERYSHRHNETIGPGTRTLRKSIPVIRAAAMVPLLKWLIADGYPVEAMLTEAGIGYVWVDDPYAPVPIRAVERFFVRAAETEGPDLGCRVVTDTSLHDIAALGAIALGARTPRESLTRVAAAMPFHCSHEFISITRGKDDSVIHEYWNMTLDPTAQHLFQQLVAALVQKLVSFANPDTPVFTRLEIIPHPTRGLEHLRPWFACDIRPATRSRLDLTVRNAVLDTPYRQAARDRSVALQRLPWQRLQDGTLGQSARLLIRAMLREGSPTVEHLAELADMSVRTLQRRLAEEGLSYSGLVEEARRDVALAALCTAGDRIGDIAAQVGYAKHSSFSRAFRRWTGQAPLARRAEAASPAE